MQCLICKKHYKHLGSHIARGHKILVREYKKTFGLDLNFPLIEESIKIKKQEHYAKHREKYLKNILNGGKNNRFKKGHANRFYFSDQSIKKAKENLDKINNKEPRNCPVCNLRTKHLGSHLFNKHGLVVVNVKKFNKK